MLDRINNFKENFCINNLFSDELEFHNSFINEEIRKSSILIIGAAGTIGQNLAIEIYKRNPLKLHLVDINENESVELVRYLRSSQNEILGEFKSIIMNFFDENFKKYYLNEGPFDYIFNLSAIKHVRSEKDQYTLLNMINTNIISNYDFLKNCLTNQEKKFFSVSTDKATMPLNMMGASKKIMEKVIFSFNNRVNVSSARFANIAFSNGSLLDSFIKRITYKQPISAPIDIKRYFMSKTDSANLCLLSGFLGDHLDIFYPKFYNKLTLRSFDKIAIDLLNYIGYDTYFCNSEEEARSKTSELIPKNIWPCYFFKSKTSGEKDIEEFVSKDDIIDCDRFKNIGVIKEIKSLDISKSENFFSQLRIIANSSNYQKSDFIKLFSTILPNYKHDGIELNLDKFM